MAENPLFKDLVDAIMSAAENGYYEAKALGASDDEALQASIGMFARYASETAGVRATWEAKAQFIDDAIDANAEMGGE